MSREIENVVVEGISLVTKDYTPAVPKAETGFALFKAQPKWMAKLKKTFGLGQKPAKVKKGFKVKKIMTAEQKQKLRKIRLDMINV